MSTTNEAMNYLADLAASTKFETDLHVPTWASGTAGSAYAVRWGCLVTLTISNVTRLAVGSNVVFYLPEGWAPRYGSVYMIVGRPGANQPGTSDIRMGIGTNGRVELWNYRSTAITSNPNSTVSVTYVCNRTIGS